MTDDSITTIQYAISLGSGCQVAHNLRRHYGFGDAFPFDWWVSSIPGIIAVLERSIDLYAPGNLVPAQGPNGIINIRTAGGQIHLHHEFDRLWRREGAPVIPEWREYLEHPRQRTTYLIDKLFSLDTEEHDILFVRQNGFPEPCRRLVETVRRLFTRARCHFLFVNIPEEPRAGEDCWYGSVLPGANWKGDPQEWDRLLSGLPFRLHNPRLKLGKADTEPDEEDDRPY